MLFLLLSPFGCRHPPLPDRLALAPSFGELRPETPRFLLVWRYRSTTLPILLSAKRIIRTGVWQWQRMRFSVLFCLVISFSFVLSGDGYRNNVRKATLRVQQ